MPVFTIPPSDYEVSRNAMLVDTNVLVHAFDKSESKHEDARYFLDEWDAEWLIPVGVVVETWGMLVGKNRNATAGYDFLRWLNTPGKALVLTQDIDLPEVVTLTTTARYDCVDALLIILSSRITEQCALRPPIPVATFDTRDFFRIATHERLKIAVFDMNSYETY
jgi:predicted nucleic acid-binding protein